MSDLSKHIQENARLELEALEASTDECSFLSAQNSAQAMRIDELQAEIGRLRLDAMTWWKRVSDLEEDLAAANARAEQNEKDAERYRHIREAEDFCTFTYNEHGRVYLDDPTELDAAIDAAIDAARGAK